MVLKSVEEYADDQDPKLSKQAVLKQIWEKRLPKGVKAQKVGKLGYVIIISKKRKKRNEKNDINS